ncbi:MAG: hypothetical protein H6713_13430 [Myxococcales bacterium]|nr:hypothetical protein [Myxococcales bacterium]
MPAERREQGRRLGVVEGRRVGRVEPREQGAQRLGARGSGGGHRQVEGRTSVAL